MSIEIRGGRGGHIRITGDVETVLVAPYARRGLPFILGFSDGSLIEGSYEPETGSYVFRPLVEGAGILTVERSDDSDVPMLDWAIEWATIAPISSTIVADRCPIDVPMPSVFDDDEHVGSVGQWLRPNALRQHGRPLLPMS
ncbi:MAG TPA: hypothetical protein VKQ09_06870 [Sphingomonas sp.]|nr:hypothetical protein [Sphingomonas sp.]